MTTPAASKRVKGRRQYTIVDPTTRELLDLPAWSTLKSQMYSFALERWKMEKVARAVAMSTALQMEAADPEKVRQATRKALDGDTAAADIGTMVHSYAEKIDAGVFDVEFVPPAAKPWIDRYLACKALYQWQTVEAEVTVANLTFGYAGSADKFAQFPGLPYLLDLPDPDNDIFGVDLKTGKSVWPETALQLACYVNGEFIFEAPDKMSLGFTIREQQLADEIASGVGFDRINPGRRKWSKDAIDEAKAALDDEWWAAYAEHAKHRPMPAGLRKDVGLVIHLTADACEVIPVRLDGDGPGQPMLVLAGLCCLYRFNARRNDVILPALDEGKPNDSTAASPNPGVDSVAGDDDSEATPGPDPLQVVARESAPSGARVLHHLADPIDCWPETVPAGPHAASPDIADHNLSDPIVDRTAAVLRGDRPAVAAPTDDDYIALPDGWTPGDRATHYQQWYSEGGATYRAADLCREWLQGCVDCLTIPQKEKLVGKWPVGVPTLKQSTEHTAFQLDSIRVVIASVTFADYLPHPADYLNLTPETITAAVDTLDRSGLTFTEVDPGDVPAPQFELDACREWLEDIQRWRAHLLVTIRTALDSKGLTRKLAEPGWTKGELTRWRAAVAEVERAAYATPQPPTDQPTEEDVPF